MKTVIRITVEHYNAETHEVIESEVIRDDGVFKPEHLKELGYLHSEQMDLFRTYALMTPANFGSR